jgi:hypothetical protein
MAAFTRTAGLESLYELAPPVELARQRAGLSTPPAIVD